MVQPDRENQRQSCSAAIGLRDRFPRNQGRSTLPVDVRRGASLEVPGKTRQILPVAKQDQMLLNHDRHDPRVNENDWMIDDHYRREYLHANYFGLAAVIACLVAGLVVLLGALLATPLVGLYFAAAMVISLCLAFAMLMPPGSTDVAA